MAKARSEPAVLETEIHRLYHGSTPQWILLQVMFSFYIIFCGDKPNSNRKLTISNQCLALNTLLST